MALTQVDQGLLGTYAQYTGFKNRILNGQMAIDQRNAGASVTNVAVTGTYTLDRWRYYGTSASKFTVQQNAGSVTPPVGFTNYLGITSLSANTPAATDEYILTQNIEGYNIADLGWGTASAKTITISFQVYSSLTGTFSGALGNSAVNRAYPFTYSIPVANTWTTISITIAGDTSGTWLTTNGVGIRVNFNLGTGSTYLGTAGSWSGTYVDGATGSVNILGTNGATFYITGVQLEKGSTATSFDYRPYTTELQLCQRYYQQNSGSNIQGAVWSPFMIAYATTAAQGTYVFPVVMRAAPTVSYSGTFTIEDGSNTFTSTASLSQSCSTYALNMWLGGFTGLVQWRSYYAYAGTNSALKISAEL